MARRNRGLVPTRVNDGYKSEQAEQRQRVARIEQRMIASWSWSGPLPPADELVKYQAIKPDLPDIMIANWQRQTDHRLHLEKTVIEADVRRADLGQRGGFVFMMALLIGSIFLFETGHESFGILAFLTDLALVGGSFGYAELRRRQERNRKSGG